ncbi:flagellar hook-associated protein 3 FlgL [Neorhizobium huautlense]|uniref:Flagellin n=1 Tax=Neorhizobium huautlense TaxID=67774 RepID=A0ABT9PUF8_9HYPH|nr:flagellar hook-associated family protein [Neorhizobium huautlense]MDP9837753.1 flagellar hook-associated protein 3 FlgL [Neorhizobium huautlense]
MKTSFSSTHSIQTTLLQTMARAQNDLATANKEVTTGVYADLGVELGAKTSRSLDLSRDMLRIESQMTTNSIATQRLTSSEEALSQLADISQGVMDSLVGLSSSSSTLDVARATITSALNSFTDVANTSVSGEYLFSGTNSDVKPMLSYEAGSALDLALTAFESGYPDPSTMTAAEMSAFLGDLQAQFNDDTFWSDHVSAASDANITTRISPTEVIDTSTNANNQGFRAFVFASVISARYLTNDIPEATRVSVTESATASIGKAISGLNDQRSAIGLSTERVSKATGSLSDQKVIIETHINELQGVDVYEASTRVSALQSLLEASYTLTSRIQQLSLVNYL